MEWTDGRTEGRTDDAKTISLRLRQGITNSTNVDLSNNLSNKTILVLKPYRFYIACCKTLLPDLASFLKITLDSQKPSTE